MKSLCKKEKSDLVWLGEFLYEYMDTVDFMKVDFM